MKLTIRTIHRDLGYFYVGLIVAFSVSGVFLNHRHQWFPSEYRYNTVEVKAPLPSGNQGFDDNYIVQLSKLWGLEGQFKGYHIRGNSLHVTYSDYIVEFDTKTGIGVKESYVKVPVLAQFTQLHMNTHDAWIWYSDIFGLALAVIAVTGLMVQKGRNSFKKRGWYFALAGVAFPVLFLLIAS